MPSTNQPEPTPDYTPTTWGGELFEDVRVPSGQLCQMRKVNARVLVALGLIDTMDPLTALVDAKHIKRVKSGGSSVPEVDAQSLMKDPEAVVKLLDITDKLIEALVVQPNVKRPIRIVDGKEFDLKPHERVPGQIYTDMVDDMDKVFLFQWAMGGTADLEQFRVIASENDGGVQPKPKTARAPKRTVRSK